ncbi:alpha/beta fold hydrolase [Halobacillus sp. Marseille-Q1614]|uniref:alpha/beta fold hydrolase n=1 Tax=Halobacillus sp. Marseille-Q1614 TaxID=2709134 RepID=UPI00156D7CF2|nr:alpha/beta fold hydrolase [Halobacillus sp. Marseille-Q1614]
MTKKQYVKIESAGIQLAGTYSVPEQPSGDAVLIVAGSGEVDRDGNAKKFKADLYKDLAEFFNEQGAAVLRYDKRGVKESKGSYAEAGLSDFIEDAASALRFLKQQEGIERVYLLGHSEGAIMGPAIFEKEPADGFVFLCGSIGTGEELIAYQNERIRKEVRETKGFKGWLFRTLKVENKIKKQSAQVESKINATTEPVVRYRGIRLNAKWMREIKAYDMRSYFSCIPEKTIAIEGGMDVQVELGSARQLSEQTGAELKEIPDMNHVLRKQTEQGSLLNLKKIYKKSLAEEKLHPELLHSLKTWLEK